MKSTPVGKVLFFTSVPLGKEDNGGSIVCRLHLRQLAACDGLEVHAATLQRSDQADQEREFLDALGVEHHLIHLQWNPCPPRFAKYWLPAWRWPFLLEREALACPCVSGEFCALAERLKPDIVVIDYLLSSLFIPSVFSLPVRIVTITLNREAEFHAQTRRAGRLRAGDSRSIIAQWRLARFERSVYRNSDAVVVLSEGDVPSDPHVRERTTILEPLLDRRPDRWRQGANKELFFVGNIVHYPNFLAVKWLAEQFAPALARRRPDARIRIVGTAVNQIPPDWNCENIDYMGPCDEQTLTGLFMNSDLFIAPIENNFGAKMKVMQCLAHGTPILATLGALSGVPFKCAIPTFSLTDAEGAADLAAELLGDEKRLAELSRVATSEHGRLSDTLSESWRRLIMQVKARPPRLFARAPRFKPLWWWI